MKKILLLLVLAFLIMGCGKKEKEGQLAVRATPMAEKQEPTDAPEELVLLTPTLTPTPTSEPEMTVHFIDAGQGLSVLVRSGKHSLIYDGGGKDSVTNVVSYLEKQQVKEIDYLISSHYDEEHLSGLIDCLDAFDVKEVIGSDYAEDSDIYRTFERAVFDEGLVIKAPKVGKEFELGTGKFTILAAAKNNDAKSENSIVIKIENGDNSFILTGDADGNVEKEMCDSELILKADVLCVSQHGSASATTSEFLEKVAPKYAIISCGEENQYGYPDKETMDRLETMKIDVYRTDLQGSIIVTSNGKELKWNIEPCNIYLPGEKPKEKVQPTIVEVQQPTATATPEPVAPRATEKPEKQIEESDEDIPVLEVEGDLAPTVEVPMLEAPN